MSQNKSKDPDALLHSLRAVATRLRRQVEEAQASGDPIHLSEEEVLRLAAGFLELDDWMFSENPMPQSWVR